MTAKKKDLGFVADIVASDTEEATRLLQLIGAVEYSEVCEHDWHCYGTVNGATRYGCQKCGATR
jgi:hypothetical protein